MDPGATPCYCKARTVPYAMRDKVEAELNRLAQEGTLKPTEHSDWAAPIVAVLKSDKKSVRICGDFRMTLYIDSASQEFVVINTHKGLFSFNRLPYGVSSALSGNASI